MVVETESGRHMNTAKDAILAKIRGAVSPPPVTRESDYLSLARCYTQSGALNQEDRVRLFEDRLRDYDAVVYRCSEQDLRQMVARALTTREKRALIIPRDLPRHWLPESFDFRVDENSSYDQLDSSEGVLTGCAVAIAITGTIVLRHSEGEGRRALTLIPDYHLCIVYASQIVETVVEGIRQMAQFSNRPITTISGPSATSDIEMTRIKGVHGPRTLDVILVA